MGEAARASRRLPAAIVLRRGRGLPRGTGLSGLPGGVRVVAGSGVPERAGLRSAPAGPCRVSGRTRVRAGPGLRARPGVSEPGLVRAGRRLPEGPGLRAGPGGYPADGVAAGGRAPTAGVPRRPGALVRRGILWAAGAVRVGRAGAVAAAATAFAADGAGWPRRDVGQPDRRVAAAQ